MGLALGFIAGRASVIQHNEYTSLASDFGVPLTARDRQQRAAPELAAGNRLIGQPRHGPCIPKRTHFRHSMRATVRPPIAADCPSHRPHRAEVIRAVVWPVAPGVGGRLSANTARLAVPPAGHGIVPAQAFMSAHCLAFRPKIHSASAESKPTQANGIQTMNCGE